MAVPALLNSSVDTFNTWLAATNNLINHVSNSSTTIQVSQNATPTPTTGNVAVNGTATILNLVVTGSANLSISTLNSSANVYLTGTTLNMTGFLQVTGNIGTSGALLVTGNGSIGGTFRTTGNATFENKLTVNGAAVFSNTVSVAGMLSNWSSPWDNLIAADGFTWATSNVSNYAAYFKGAKYGVRVVVPAGETGLSVTGNTTLDGFVTFPSGNVTGNLAIGGTSTLLGNVTTNAAVLLSGPFGWSRNEVDVPMVGAGPHNDLGSVTTGYANCVILRLAPTAQASVSGLHINDPSKHREIIVLNVSAYDILWLHQNTASVANNRVICPASTTFVQTVGSALRFVYDVTATYRWRIVSGSATLSDANTSVPGIVSIGAQTFGGAKSFANTVNLNVSGGRLVLPVGADMWAV